MNFMLHLCVEFLCDQGSGIKIDHIGSSVHFAHLHEPVSYTHLDVYKRQALGAAGSASQLLQQQLFHQGGIRPLHHHINGCLLYTSPSWVWKYCRLS